MQKQSDSPWRAIPGAENYQANIDTGEIKSLNHISNGQQRRGRILKLGRGLINAQPQTY